MKKAIGFALVASVSLYTLTGVALAEAPKTLTVILPNLTNPYYVIMKNSFEENGAKAGYDVKVLISDDDDAKQLSIAQTVAQQKTDAVVLNCVSSGPCPSAVLELNAADIPVFTINLLPDPDGLKQQNAKVVQSIETDQAAGGRFIGEQLLKEIGPNGSATVGIVGQPTAVATIQRDDGFKEGVAANPNVKVVALVDGKVQETTSLRVTTEMLQGNPAIDVVFSDTEAAALGAAAAIESLGLEGKVTIYAYVDKEGVKRIDNNSIFKAGAIQEPAKLAVMAIDGVTKHLAGETIPASIMSPPLLVSKDNAKQVVDLAY